ncbi:MAG TPA: hypothetical protein VIY29_06340 [Ktedonobacteraceae bacterium]
MTLAVILATFGRPGTMQSSWQLSVGLATFGRPGTLAVILEPLRLTWKLFFLEVKHDI